MNCCKKVKKHKFSNSPAPSISGTIFFLNPEKKWSNMAKHLHWQTLVYGNCGGAAEMEESVGQSTNVSFMKEWLDCWIIKINSYELNLLIFTSNVQETANIVEEVSCGEIRELIFLAYMKNTVWLKTNPLNLPSPP